MLSAKIPPRRRGRPRKRATEEMVAAHMGVSAKTARRARQHVETAGAYPFMGSAQWAQRHVLDARRALLRYPEGERPRAAALAGLVAEHPHLAVRFLSRLAALPDDERAEAYALPLAAATGDRILRSTFVTAEWLLDTLAGRPVPAFVYQDAELREAYAATMAELVKAARRARYLVRYWAPEEMAQRLGPEQEGAEEVLRPFLEWISRVFEARHQGAE